MLSEKFLAEIQAEILEREAELEEWRALERLAVKLGAEGPRLMRRETPALPPPAPAPQAARRRADAGHRARRPRGLAQERAEKIMGVLSARGALPPAALREALQLNRNEIQRPLAQLLKEGRITVSGVTSLRIYDVARNGSPPPPLSPRVAKLEGEAKASGNGEVEIEDLVLDVVRRSGGRLPISEIGDEIRRHGHGHGHGLDALGGAVDRLVTHGLLLRDEVGRVRLAPEPQGERPLEDVIADVAGVDSL